MGFQLEILAKPGSDLNPIPVVDNNLFQILKRPTQDTNLLKMSLTKSISSRFQNQTTQLKSLEYLDLMQIENIKITFSTEYLDLEIPEEFALKIDQIRNMSQMI